MTHCTISRRNRASYVVEDARRARCGASIGAPCPRRPTHRPRRSACCMCSKAPAWGRPRWRAAWLAACPTPPGAFSPTLPIHPAGRRSGRLPSSTAHRTRRQKPSALHWPLSLAIASTLTPAYRRGERIEGCSAQAKASTRHASILRARPRDACAGLVDGRRHLGSAAQAPCGKTSRRQATSAAAPLK